MREKMLLVETVEPWNGMLFAAKLRGSLWRSSCPLKAEMQKQWAGHLLTTEIPQIIVRKAPLRQMNNSEIIYGPFCCVLQVAFPVIVLIKQ